MTGYCMVLPLATGISGATDRTVVQCLLRRILSTDGRPILPGDCRPLGRSSCTVGGQSSNPDVFVDGRE